MSAEKIIKQIQKDAEQKIQNIQNEAETKIKKINKEAEIDAKKTAEEIKKQGEKDSENIEKIKISKANQESKKKILNAKEEIIDKVFKKAIDELGEIDEKTYKKIVKRLLREAEEKLGSDCKIKNSCDIDKKIAEDQNIKVFEKIEATGGFIAYSSDEKVTLDLTFEGIMKREKDKLRIKIGSLLFS